MNRPDPRDPTDPQDATGATLVTEQASRRNVSFGAVVALLAVAIIWPMVRDEPVDAGTQLAIGALALVACGVAGLWVHLARNPTTLVIADDHIRLDPPGARPELRRIGREDGPLRLAKVGSIRSKTLMLSTRRGDGQIPLHFMDRDQVLDACDAHGWEFGD